MDPGLRFLPGSHRHAIPLESSPDIPELSRLAKENSGEACLGTGSSPSLSRKTKNIYTAGAPTPTSPPEFVRPRLIGGTSEGACVFEHGLVRPGQTENTVAFPWRQGWEKVLEEAGRGWGMCPATGVGVQCIHGSGQPCSGSARSLSTPHLQTLVQSNTPRSG